MKRGKTFKNLATATIGKEMTDSLITRVVSKVYIKVIFTSYRKTPFCSLNIHLRPLGRLLEHQDDTNLLSVQGFTMGTV